MPSPTQKPKWRFEAILPIIAGVIGLLGTMMAALISNYATDIPTISRNLESEKRIAELVSIIEKQNQRLSELEAKIASLSQITPDTQASMQINQLNNTISKLQESTSNIEKIILDNPSKALAVPLIRRDIDNLE